jgi:hypothetical protein
MSIDRLDDAPEQVKAAARRIFEQQAEVTRGLIRRFGEREGKLVGELANMWNIGELLVRMLAPHVSEQEHAVLDTQHGHLMSRLTDVVAPLLGVEPNELAQAIVDVARSRRLDQETGEPVVVAPHGAPANIPPPGVKES